MPIRRTKRYSNLRSKKRTGRKLKQFSQYGMDALASRTMPLHRRSSNVALPYPKRRVQRRVSNLLNEPGSGYQQFSYTKIATGKKQRQNLLTVIKDLRSTTDVSVFKYNGVKNFDDNGNYWIGRYLTSAGLGPTQLPLYLFDLTAVPNMNIGAGSNTPIYPVSMKRAQVHPATGGSNGFISWIDQYNRAPDGTGNYTYPFVEKSTSQINTKIYPHESSKLLYTDIRMNLWGSKTKAHKFTIQLVKFTDDANDPWVTTGAGNTVTYNRHNAFWQAMVKPQTFNPISTTGATEVKGMKVLKSYSRIIQPTSTTENDTDPHSVVLKWFARWDRSMYYGGTAGKLDDNINLTADSDYAIEQAQNDCYVMPKSKIFLLIRCSDYAGLTDPAAITNSQTASFDLSVRMAHVV